MDLNSPSKKTQMKELASFTSAIHELLENHNQVFRMTSFTISTRQPFPSPHFQCLSNDGQISVYICVLIACSGLYDGLFVFGCGSDADESHQRTTVYTSSNVCAGFQILIIHVNSRMV